MTDIHRVLYRYIELPHASLSLKKVSEAIVQHGCRNGALCCEGDTFLRSNTIFFQLLDAPLQLSGANRPLDDLSDACAGIVVGLLVDIELLALGHWCDNLWMQTSVGGVT